MEHNTEALTQSPDTAGELPRVKLIPLKVTWSCPQCNYQNTVGANEPAEHSPVESVCGVCMQHVILGSLRDDPPVHPRSEGGYTFPKWHGDAHVGIGFDHDICPLCAAIERVESQKAELNSITEIFEWFTMKLNAIKLDGTTPQDVMTAFSEIIQTCKRAKGMARLAKPARTPSQVESEAAMKWLKEANKAASMFRDFGWPGRLSFSEAVAEQLVNMTYLKPPPQSTQE